MTSLSRQFSELPPARTPVSAPFVSVVIPCFDYADYLAGAVMSAIEQRCVRVEVIVVDDASTDGSVAVAQALASAHPEVTVLAHPINRGPVVTFNDGLAVARGEFLVRLDADDVLTPGSLERAVAVAQAFPDVGLVYGHPLHVTGDHFPTPRSRPSSWTVWPGRAWLADRCRDGLNVITSPEVLMRKSVVDELGGQMPLAHTHDMEMWFRIAAFADVAYIHGVDQAWHRDHPRSLSSREVDPLRDLHERKAAFATLFDGPAGSLDNAVELHESADRAVAEYAVALAIGQFDRRDVDHSLVHACMEFARECVSAPESLLGWCSLQQRLRRGHGSSMRLTYFLDRVVRRVRSDRSWRSWHRNGVF